MPNSVTLDFSKAVPINPAAGVTLDFSKAQPVGSTPGADKITGISAPAGDSVNVAGQEFKRPATDSGYKIDKWMESVRNDVKQGTDATGIGALLKGMGAHGLDVGGPKDFLPHVMKMAMGLLGGPGAAESPIAGETVANKAKEMVNVGSQGAVPPIADIFEHMVPSNARAKAALENLKETIGSHPVDMTDRLKSAMDNVRELQQSGNGQMPTVVKGLMDRLTDMDAGPLTYSEARNFESGANAKLSAAEAMNMKGPMWPALNEFKAALREAVTNTASAAGKSEQYLSALKEYAQHQKLGEFGTKIINAAIKAGLAATGAAGLGAAGHAGWNLFNK